MKKNINTHLANFLKGIGIGTANVIPGVSGATIAVITGIFEQLINAVKSFDITALQLLCRGKFRTFSQHTDLPFLVPVMIGVLGSVLSLAKLLEYLFDHYPVFIWAYFFGLILASVYYVGKTVDKWTFVNITLCAAGAAFAIVLTFLHPAVENRDLLYVFLCGIIAICSMILPGISGSFILILMGNYELIVLEAINQRKLSLLMPFIAGCGIGLVVFSHILSWILKKFKHQTIAILTGFICGSLVTIWPWKDIEALKPHVINGESMIPKPVLPQAFDMEVQIAILIMVAGIISIWITETMATKSQD